MYLLVRILLAAGDKNEAQMVLSKINVMDKPLLR